MALGVATTSRAAAQAPLALGSGVAGTSREGVAGVTSLDVHSDSPEVSAEALRRAVATHAAHPLAAADRGGAGSFKWLGGHAAQPTAGRSNLLAQAHCHPTRPEQARRSTRSTSPVARWGSHSGRGFDGACFRLQ